MDTPLMDTPLMDTHYETALLEQPKNIELWKAYSSSRQNDLEKAKVLARAVLNVPDEDLWKEYLNLRAANLQGPASEAALEATLKDALALFPENKAFWEFYIEKFPKPDTFDAVLRYRPDLAPRIWPLYLALELPKGDGENIVARYLEYAGDISEAVDLLPPEKALRVLQRSNPQTFAQWQDLLEVASQVEDREYVFKSALALFPSNDAWIVPEYAAYIARTSPSEAMALLMASLSTATSMNSFAVIFDAACQLHEALIGARLEQKLPVDRALAEYTLLLDRRPLYLNDVLIRLEPTLVVGWLDRADLFVQPEIKADIYKEGLAAVGSAAGVADLWLAYASLSKSDLTEFRTVLDRATKSKFAAIADLEDIWLFWAASEDPQQARKVLETAVKGPKQSSVKFDDMSRSPQDRLHKSRRLWSELLAVAVDTASLDEVRGLYARVFDLKIVSARNVDDFATLLDSKGFKEESFRVYERAVSLFPFPAAHEIWKAYLEKAVDFLGVERIRDLYEQVLREAPQESAGEFYIQYTWYELEHGLVSNAFAILDRAIAAVPSLDLFQLYVDTLRSHREPEMLRPVYQAALDVLDDAGANSMAKEFAELELELGDLARAQAIFRFAAQFNDPQRPAGAVFWERWKEVETEHGSAESYQQMELEQQRVEEEILNDARRLALRQETIEFVKET